MNHQQMIKPMLIGVAVLVGLGLAGLPVLNYLPLIIILACPLMMMLMMGGGHGGSKHDKTEPEASEETHVGHGRRDER